MNKVLILTTWWTIDKDYSTKKWTRDLEIWEPAVKRIIEYGRMFNLNVELLELLKKDSLDMTNEDRNKIKEVISKREEKAVLITHGTDTMIETWKVLKELANKKAIVLVGSSLPEVFKNSDAPVNVWFALWVLKSLMKFKQTWVYLCMNWEIFDIDNVEKWEDWIFRKKIRINLDQHIMFMS